VISVKPLPDDDEALARQRRAARIERYEQNTKRTSRCLAEVLAKGGDKVFRQLIKSLQRGEFNSGGRCRVLWLHPWSPPQRMTPELIASQVEIYKATPSTIRDQVLARCWIPAEMAASWAKAHGIKLDVTNTRGRPKGQRQVVNANDAQYLWLVAKYRAEGKSEREAVRLALENKQLDGEKYWIERQQKQKPRARTEVYRNSEASRIRKKFRDGQRQ
jgi:hypothetical protein